MRGALGPGLTLALALWCGFLGTSGRAAEPTALAAEPAAKAAPEPGEQSLEDVMARFAGSGGVRARFRETKRLSLLTEALETEGVVSFEPPDRLARHTTRPGESSVVVHGSRLAIRDETGHQVLELDEKDPARHFVDSLAVLLRGDAEALRERYVVSFRSEEGGWKLELEPRSKALRRMVASIDASGRDARLLRMQVRETNGDSSVTEFFEVETGIEFDPAEAERIFSVEAERIAPVEAERIVPVEDPAGR